MDNAKDIIKEGLSKLMNKDKTPEAEEASGKKDKKGKAEGGHDPNANIQLGKKK